MKSNSKQSKRRDLHLKLPHRETNYMHFIIVVFTTVNKTRLFYDNDAYYISPRFIKGSDTLSGGCWVFCNRSELSLWKPVARFCKPLNLI